MSEVKYYINCQYQPRKNTAPQSDIIVYVNGSGHGFLYGYDRVRSSFNKRSIGTTITLGDEVSQSDFEQRLSDMNDLDLKSGYYIKCSYKNTAKKEQPIEACIIDLHDNGSMCIYAENGSVINTTMHQSKSKLLSFGNLVSSSKFKMTFVGMISNEQRQSKIDEAKATIASLEYAKKHINNNGLYTHADVASLVDNCDVTVLSHPFSVELLSRTSTILGLKSVLRGINVIVPFLQEKKVTDDDSKKLARYYVTSCASLATTEVAKVCFSIAVSLFNQRYDNAILPLTTKRIIFTKEKLEIIGKSYKKTTFTMPSPKNVTMKSLISFSLVAIDMHLDDLIGFERTSLELNDFEVLNKLKEDELHLRSYNIMNNLNIIAQHQGGLTIYAPSVLTNNIQRIIDKLTALNVSLANDEPYDVESLSDDIDAVEDFCNAYNYLPETNMLTSDIKIENVPLVVH